MENKTQTNKNTEEDRTENLTEDQKVEVEVHVGDIWIDGDHNGVYDLISGNTTNERDIEPKLRLIEVHRNGRKYIDRNVVLESNRVSQKQVEEKVRAMLGDEELFEGKCDCRVHRS